MADAKCLVKNLEVKTWRPIRLKPMLLTIFVVSYTQKTVIVDTDSMLAKKETDNLQVNSDS